MKWVLGSELSKELLRSERKRAIILIAVFSFGVVYRLISNALFDMADDGIGVESQWTIWMFPVALILFEILSLLYFNKQLKEGRKQIPIAVQYLNTAFEIFLPSTVILFFARQNPSFNVLDSPMVLIYFIFIILSTLRLSFVLSFLCGLLASISYILFSIFIYDHFSSQDGIKSVLLLFGGICAGLVAMQIRAGLHYSLKEVEKRLKVENLFGQQISMEIVEKILENDGKMESKRMRVAIMFIDIRNFTQYVSDKTPEEIVQYQNAFFNIVINAVSSHKGIINQLLGDGCMVTFGAPVVLTNSAQNAVNAALEILRQLNLSSSTGNIAPTNIGIGIHVGEAVTGNIGTAQRQQYSITGNVVLLASRIEQLNKEFGSQILISGDVANAIDPLLNHNYIGPVDLKGWPQQVDIFKLA